MFVYDAGLAWSRKDEVGPFRQGRNLPMDTQGLAMGEKT